MSFITNISFDPKTGELVVTRQDYEVRENALAPSGEPSEDRVSLLAPGVVLNCSISLDSNNPPMLKVEARNSGLLSLTDASVKLISDLGQAQPHTPLNPIQPYPEVFAPGEVRYYHCPSEVVSQFVRDFPGGRMKIAFESQGQEVARIEGAELHSFLNC